MSGSDDFIFINRDRELEFLLNCLPPTSRRSTLVIIVAPSGFGKSTLTDQLLRRAAVPNFALVDPNIRQKSGDARIYEGFFIQKCAQELSARCKGQNYPSFQRFLKERKWRTMREKSHTDVMRKYPSPSNLYEIAVGYFDRLLGKRDFASDALLASDTAHAVTVSREYVEFVCKDDETLLVIRESQHIDHESLRFFLQNNRDLQHQYLIMEYTSEKGHFDPDHQKILLRELTDHPNAHIMELMRLEKHHLETLLRMYATNDVALNSDFSLNWDGNLRHVVELRFRAGIGRKIHSAADIQNSLSDLEGQLNEHFNVLNRRQKLMLALVLAHIEAIHHQTMLLVAARIDQHTTVPELENNLMSLVNIHKFLELNHGFVRLQNEDLAMAIANSPTFGGLIVLASRELRDYYLELIHGNNYTVTGMPMAVRQALSLCAKTGDMTAIVRIVKELSGIIRQTNDQSIYVDAIAEAIADKQNLFQSEHEALVDWAAELAYDAADYKRAADLLRSLPSPNSYQAAMLACCAQELGEHEFALTVLHNHRSPSRDRSGELLAELIEMTTIRDMGDEVRAKNILDKIHSDPTARVSPIFGYALRFYEMLLEFPESTPFMLESAEWFKRYGLINPEAYSRLSGAILLARAGRIDEALEFMQRATKLLKSEVRDQYTVLNNKAVLAMLVPQPDFSQCISWLNAGMRVCRNDYADVVLLNNLAIAKNQLGLISDAIECVDRMLTILKEPSFGDRDIFWGACFNAMRIFERAGQKRRAEDMRILPRAVARSKEYSPYWEYRFDLRSDIDEQYRYLLKFDYHPLYLSHWLIELEGLKLLKQGQQK